MVLAAIASDGQTMDPIIFAPGTAVSSAVYQNLVISEVKCFMEMWAPTKAVFQPKGASQD